VNKTALAMQQNQDTGEAETLRVLSTIKSFSNCHARMLLTVDAANSCCQLMACTEQQID
jgi:hypothetical protein